MSRPPLLLALVALLALPLPARADVIELPEPDTDGEMSLEQALAQRRSRRSFTAGELTQQQLGQLLWAAQGVTDRRGFRTAPSAGARHPLEIYVVTPAGAFHYLPARHALRLVQDGDLRDELWDHVYGRDSHRAAAAAFVITAVYARTAKRYGGRAKRYARMEAGHACQNLLLQATALGLDAVPLGAFHERELTKLLGLPSDHAPLYLVPVGLPAERAER